MALVNIDTILHKVTTTLARLGPDQGLTILSYKRDRGVDIMKGEGERVWVRERGYEEQEFDLGLAELPRLLKTICRREFPRSRKVRLYQLAEPAELDRVHKKL